MSEKLVRLARQYGRTLSAKQYKIFFKALIAFPFKQRMIIAWKVFWKIDIVKFTQKENLEIRAGRYLK